VEERRKEEGKRNKGRNKEEAGNDKGEEGRRGKRREERDAIYRELVICKLNLSQTNFSTVFKCIGVLKRTQIQARMMCEREKGKGGEGKRGRTSEHSIYPYPNKPHKRL